MTAYDAKVQDILANAERYHEAFLKAETFGGPSLYFHQRALATRGEPASEANLDYVYATLASWGMTRFDFGGIDPRSPSASGVDHFKRGFGGELIQHLGEWEWAATSPLRWAANVLIRRRAVL